MRMTVMRRYGANMPGHAPSSLSPFGRKPLKRPGLHHALLIDDTYNANPESVRAALAVLAATAGKKILVLGDMGELGASAIDLHRTIGRDARNAGLDPLLTLGERRS